MSVGDKRNMREGEGRKREIIYRCICKEIVEYMYTYLSY